MKEGTGLSLFVPCLQALLPGQWFILSPSLLFAGSLAVSTVDTYTAPTSTESITTAWTPSATTRYSNAQNSSTAPRTYGGVYVLLCLPLTGTHMHFHFAALEEDMF